MEGFIENSNEQGNVSQDTLRTQILETINETENHPLAKQFLKKQRSVETMHNNLEKVVGLSNYKMTEKDKSDFFDSFTQNMGQYESQHIGGGESWFMTMDWLEAQNLVLYKPEFLQDVKDSKMGHIEIVALSRFLKFAKEEDIQSAKELVNQHGLKIFGLLGCLNYIPEIPPSEFIKKLGNADRELLSKSLQYVSDGLEKLYGLLQTSANLLDTIQGDKKKMYEVFAIMEKNNEILAPIAEKMLRSFFDYIKNGDKEVFETLLKKNQKLHYLSSITGTMKEYGIVPDLENIEGAEIMEITSAELRKDEKLKQRMIEIATENYKNDPILSKEIPKLLEEKINDPAVMFMCMVYDGELSAFCRFEDVGQNTKYWGSLNVDTHSKGADIGSIILEYVMEEKFPNTILKSHCNPSFAALTTYLKRGFVVTKRGEFYGMPWFEMERNRELLEHIKDAPKTTHIVESRADIVLAADEILANGFGITAITPITTPEHETNFEIEFSYIESNL